MSRPTIPIPRIQDPQEYLRLVLSAQQDVDHYQLQAHELSKADQVSDPELRELKHNYLAVQKRVGVLVSDFGNVPLKQYAAAVFADMGVLRHDIEKLGSRIELLGQEIELKNRMRGIVDEALRAPDSAQKVPILRTADGQLDALAEIHVKCLTSSLLRHKLRMQSTLRAAVPVEVTVHPAEVHGFSHATAADRKRMTELQTIFAARANPWHERIAKVDAAKTALIEKADRRYKMLIADREAPLAIRQKVLQEEYDFSVKLLENDQETAEKELSGLKQLQDQMRQAAKIRPKLSALEIQFAKALHQTFAGREAMLLAQEKEAAQHQQKLDEIANERTSILEAQWSRAGAEITQLSKALQVAQQGIHKQFHEIAVECRRLERRYRNRLARLEKERQAATAELFKLDHSPLMGDIQQCREKIAKAEQALKLKSDHQDKMPNTKSTGGVKCGNGTMHPPISSLASSSSASSSTSALASPTLALASSSTSAHASSLLPTETDTKKTLRFNGSGAERSDTDVASTDVSKTREPAPDMSPPADADRLEQLMIELEKLPSKTGLLETHMKVVELIKQARLSEKLHLELISELEKVGRAKPSGAIPGKAPGKAPDKSKGAGAPSPLAPVKACIFKKWNELMDAWATSEG